jgi:hypothetical protein
LIAGRAVASLRTCHFTSSSLPSAAIPSRN